MKSFSRLLRKDLVEFRIGSHKILLEPDPRSHERLSFCMQSADERVTPGYILFDQACSELSSHVTLSLSRTLGGSSLMDPEDHYDNEGCIEIETLSLDEIIESEGIGHVRLLKMDIEGHELPALRGLKKTLQAGLIDY